VDSKLLTLKEASELTGFQLSTWRGWVLRRKVPFHRIGRSIRIAESDVVAMIQNSRIPARPERP
jgi:excisionase family DNA binding protein